MDKLSKASQMINRSLIQSIKYSPQKQIYLHALPSATLVSFSSNPNSIPIGSIPSLKKDELESVIIKPEQFKANADFLNVLHSTFSRSAHFDPTYQIDALNYPGSFMALGDYKIILDYMNQRPDLQNTIGFVHVGFDNIINPESYEKNDAYTVCNIDGVITLSDFMLEELQKEL